MDGKQHSPHGSRVEYENHTEETIAENITIITR